MMKRPPTNMKWTPKGLLHLCEADGMKHCPLDYLINPGSSFEEVESRIRLYLIKNDPLIKRIINEEDDDIRGPSKMQIHAIRCVIEGIINEFVTGE